MNTQSKIILAVGLLLTLLLSYLFIPSSKPVEKQIAFEVEAPFLQTDPQWADSVLATMSDEELLAQLFIPNINPALVSDSFELNFKESFAYGFSYTGNDILAQVKINKNYFQKNNYPAFFSSQNSISPFENSNNIDESILFSIHDTSIIHLFQQEYISRNHQYGFNFLKGFDLFYYDHLFPSFVSKNAVHFLTPLIQSANEKHLLFSCGKLKKTYEIQSDTLFENDTIIRALKHLADSGMTVLLVDSSYYEWKKQNQNKPLIKSFCEDRLDFRGLIAVEFPQSITDEKSLIHFFLQEGIDILFTGENHYKIISAAKKMLQEKLITTEMLHKKVRKILLARSWINEKNYPTPDRIDEMNWINDPVSKVMALKLNESAIQLVQNKNNVLPLILHPEKLPLIIEIGKTDESFKNESKNYSELRSILRFNSLDELKKINQKTLSAHSTIILCLYQQLLDSASIHQLKPLLSLQTNKKIVVAHFGNPLNLSLINSFNCILHTGLSFPENKKSMSRAIFGANAINGKSDFILPEFNRISNKLNATRLKKGAPEEVGINRDSLLKIDYIMEEGIRNRAFPGGQVFLALENTIIYHKTFGHLAYDRKIAVQPDHYYDVASITKVTGTTLMAMNLYERKKYKLDDSLGKYLPDSLKHHLRTESTIKNVTFRQLLIHASGLPAGHNIIRFLRFNDPAERYDYYFCDEKSNQFPFDLADSFYVDKRILDSLWIDLNKIWLNPDKPYCYSDANMNLLFTMLTPMIGKQKWDRYLDSVFYTPLGMRHTTFVPLKKKIEKNQIAPTEDDKYWRKDLLQGHVHDPTAALYGGVAGNAGLFSTASDLGVFCQLLLNKGHYGGVRYLDASTIELFTSQQNGTHRGLGFNRQVSGSTYGCSPYASDATYGHTGFTGTAFWVDPKIKFIYVFITNRVHTNPDNKTIIQLGTTKRVHNVVYELLLPKKNEETEEVI